MFKTMVKLFSCVIIGLCLASCTSMKCKYYVGEKLPIDKKSLGLDEESIWEIDNNAYYVRILAPETMTASTLEWDSSANKYKITTFQVLPTTLDGHHFLNLKKENEDMYTILRMGASAETQGMIVLFTVKKEKLEKDMEDGKVKAVKKGDHDYILELTKEELDNYVRQNMNNLFDYDSPGILKALKGFKAE